MKNIKDSEFIRSTVPMTKFNIRNLSIAYLNIEAGDEFLDIGGGTGSVSVEAALNGANVTAVETDDEACALIKSNAEKFGVKINLIKGKAPEILLKKEYAHLKFNKCFIGGSSGELKNIFTYLENGLEKNGILCADFILIKNLNECLDLLKQFNYTDTEVNLIQTASMGKAGLFKGENPVYIVKGIKRA
ncbi:precorrin-6Y C5,15-methyltransferase (decarboxylating) subunit CbiT [Treponema pedis]|uniref:precorrin-6Y C5,15-methyltransferase (decarboxylating) subunit CbiT n=1 Tax=Treponema pedis TaxID=409322 RepID=UPI003133E638